MTSSYLFYGALGFLPGLAWLFFFLQEDTKRAEPKGLILSTFLFGGLVTFLVLPFQILGKSMLLAGGIASGNPFHLFILAGIEELFKWSVVYAWISRRKEFDEPIDAMVYMVIAALGFVSVENVATVLRASNGVSLLTLRFIGATLLHCLASGIVGYYWARGIIACRRAGYLAFGLVAATLFHTIFNYLMVIWGPGMRVTSLLVLLAFVILRDFEELKRPGVAAGGGKCERPF